MTKPDKVGPLAQVPRNSRLLPRFAPALVFDPDETNCSAGQPLAVGSFIAKFFCCPGGPRPLRETTRGIFRRANKRSAQQSRPDSYKPFRFIQSQPFSPWVESRRAPCFINPPFAKYVGTADRGHAARPRISPASLKTFRSGGQGPMCVFSPSPGPRGSEMSAAGFGRRQVVAAA